jgi:hypothetical protein
LPARARPGRHSRPYDLILFWMYRRRIFLPI